VSSDPDPGALLPSFDLDATLSRWKVPIPVGSRWVTTPSTAGGPDGWVIAPVRQRAPAPPPGGRERRSRERLALELAGLALGALDDASAGEKAKTVSSEGAMMAHEATNPLIAARATLQLAMENIGRWIDLSAERRLGLLDDLGQVIEDIDRAAELLRVVQEQARGLAQTRTERFDAVRIVRSCLTLERRLLRDRGIELEFTTTLEPTYLKGDPNALFDLLVNLVRNAADATAQGSGTPPLPIAVALARKGRDLEVSVRDRGPGRIAEHDAWPGFAKVRLVTEKLFSGTLRVEATPSEGTTFFVTLPLPPQREGSPA
jgi:signal transduction histidine kinase